jgi:hypothetical protein
MTNNSPYWASIQDSHAEYLSRAFAQGLETRVTILWEGETVDATPTEIFLRGIEDERLLIPNNSGVHGILTRFQYNVTAGTVTAPLSQPATTIVTSSTGASTFVNGAVGNAVMSAANPNGIIMTVTGPAATVKWKVFLDMTVYTYPHNYPDFMNIFQNLKNGKTTFAVS